MAIPSPTPAFLNPVAVAGAFGRFFYGYDSRVYFSRVLTNPKLAGSCFQINDPTSDEIPDLLDTDGGYIPLDEAIKISSIKLFRTGVLVFAENGVWYVFGPDGGFKATSFNVSKITEVGVDSARSIVEAEGAVYYGSPQGIMRIVANEFDNIVANDITEQTIRKHYLNNLAGKNSQGEYKRNEKEVQWWNPDEESKGLILDLQSGGFYPQENASTQNRIGQPLVVEDKFLYTTWEDDGVSYKYGLCDITNTLFQDFGIDQEAYLITGYETLGKFSHKKSVTEAKFYFNKTETQITGYNNGQYTYDLPSSCLFQSRWDFDNSNAYSKWVGRTTSNSGSGKKTELYSPMRRGFIPTEYPWDFDTGESLISKKINVRGSGDAIQLRFEAQPQKDMQLFGYSVNYSMRGKM